LSKNTPTFNRPSFLSPDFFASANRFCIKCWSFLTGPASRSVLRRLACRAVARTPPIQPGFALCAAPRQPFALPLRFGRRLVGVTGFEPVTLRLSSACSNQLSYTPIKPNLACRAVARGRLAGPPSRIALRRGSLSPSASLRAKAGGAEGIRTPDLQLAKLPLYQLSYSPTCIYDLRFRIWGPRPANCNSQISLSSASPFHFHLMNQRATLFKN
jgi:hypothetical protein